MSDTAYYSIWVPGPINLCTDLITEIAVKSQAGDIVCLPQCGLGRDVHHLIDLFHGANKRGVKVYAFDTFGENHSGSEYWEGHPQTTPWGEPFDAWCARIGGPSRLMDQFLFHLTNSPAREYLTDWAQFPWWTVAEEFKDSTVSWVVANGAHAPKGILKEIAKWWPTLKSGGRIAAYGHDSGDFVTKLEVYRAFQVENPGVQLVGAANHVILIKP